jgi:hypothetical protein
MRGKRKEIIDIDKFNLLYYHGTSMYRVCKKCSVDSTIYSVWLTTEDFNRYYTYQGKHIIHLHDKKDPVKKITYTKENLLFLETTLTPKEVKSIPDKIKNNKDIDKKQWRFQLGLYR